MKSADQRPRNDESWLGLQAEGIAPDRQSRHPFVTGWASTTEWIAREGS
jgi:hypothetical protein